MQLESYILTSFVSYCGLLVGSLLVLMAPEEQKPGKSYFLFLQKLLLFATIAVLFMSTVTFAPAIIVFIAVSAPVIFKAKKIVEQTALIYIIFGFVFALLIAFSIRICILSIAIFLTSGFTIIFQCTPKNWFSFKMKKCSQRDSNPRHRVGNPEY